jgi:hypothetical protein
MPLWYILSKRAEIRSKHGVIISCALDVSNTCLETSVTTSLAQLSQSFEGKRYGFHIPCNPEEIGPRKDLAAWLRAAMAS